MWGASGEVGDNEGLVVRGRPTVGREGWLDGVGFALAHKVWHRGLNRWLLSREAAGRLIVHSEGLPVRKQCDAKVRKMKCERRVLCHHNENSLL